MSKIIIEDSHEYIVYTESIISSYDRKVLTRLYQPLIGSISFGLYETLLSELEFDKTVTSLSHSFKSLSKLMNSNIDDIRLSLSKLEGTGLVKSFYNKQKNLFMIEIFSPLSPSDYFDAPLLDSKLHKFLGEEDYLRTKQYFSFANISKNDFVDVSNTFNDVYDFDPNAIFMGSTNQRGKKSANIKLSFDQEAFDLRLKELQVSKSLISKSDLENIIMYSNGFNISGVDIADIVARSLDDEGHINLMILKKLSESKASGINTKRKINVIKDSGNMKLNELIEYYNSLNSKQFLTIKNNNKPILPSEILIIESLRNVYEFSDGIINCLLDYVFTRNQGKLYKPYIETIATSMNRNNIKDTYQAYEYLNKTKIKTNDNTDKQEEKVSDEEIQESLRKLEQLRKNRENGEN